jgi:hypothetical protein
LDDDDLLLASLSPRADIRGHKLVDVIADDDRRLDDVLEDLFAEFSGVDGYSELL